MKAFTVNIAVNTTSESIRRSGPIYANGSFTYIPIPWKPSNTSYADIGLSSAFKRMGIEEKVNHGVHHDPEFIGYTFGTYPEEWPSVVNLKRIEKGDLLILFGSLERTTHELLGDRFASWIADPRGMYLFGFFEVVGILTKDGEIFEETLEEKAYSTNAHYEYYESDPGNNSWIFKGSNRSCLFPTAVPVGRREFEKLFDRKLPRKTSQSETAQVSSYMRTAREVASISFLMKLISDFCPSVCLGLK